MSRPNTQTAVFLGDIAARGRAQVQWLVCCSLLHAGAEITCGRRPSVRRAGFAELKRSLREQPRLAQEHGLSPYLVFAVYPILEQLGRG